jgi:hypothetical protein
VLGAQDVRNYIDKFEHITPSNHCKEHLINFKKKEWSKYISTEKPELATSDGIDLLSRILVIDHT